MEQQDDAVPDGDAWYNNARRKHDKLSVQPTEMWWTKPPDATATQGMWQNFCLEDKPPPTMHKISGCRCKQRVGGADLMSAMHSTWMTNTP